MFFIILWQINSLSLSPRWYSILSRTAVRRVTAGSLWPVEVRFDKPFHVLYDSTSKERFLTLLTSVQLQLTRQFQRHTLHFVVGLFTSAFVSASSSLSSPTSVSTRSGWRHSVAWCCCCCSASSRPTTHQRSVHLTSPHMSHIFHTTRLHSGHGQPRCSGLIMRLYRNSQVSPEVLHLRKFGDWCWYDYDVQIILASLFDRSRLGSAVVSKRSNIAKSKTCVAAQMICLKSTQVFRPSVIPSLNFLQLNKKCKIWLQSGLSDALVRNEPTYRKSETYCVSADVQITQLWE